MELILAIDQGTHASRALLFDMHGNTVAGQLLSVDLRRPRPGRAEQDAGQILASVKSVIDMTLQSLPPRQRDAVRACGLVTQRSTVLAWHHNGTPASPALSWQDTRAAAQVAALRAHAENIRRLSGLPLSAHYGASKLHWLAGSIAEASGLRLGPLAAFLLDNLCDGGVSRVDHVNAQRMQLLDIRQRRWSQTLLDWFGIAEDQLPACAPVEYDYGKLSDHGIPITAAGGDQNAVWFSEGQPDSGRAFINIGSGAFILAAGGDGISDSALLNSIASSSAQGCEYLLEATVNGAGSALQWLQEAYGGGDPGGKLADWLQQVSTPPLFINTVGGLGSPWWQHNLAPAFHPDSTQYTPAERAVAVAESILFLLQCNLERMQHVRPLRHLRVSGGLSRIAPLCQKLANLSGLPVSRSQQREASARGIAWLAAGRPADWARTDDVQLFAPQPDSGLAGRYSEFVEQLLRRIEAGNYD